MVGFGALLTAAYARHHSSARPAGTAAFDPAAYTLSGFFLAQPAIGVLGIIVITSEYPTGTIRSTFAAAPQRGAVLAAKAAVFGTVAAAGGIASSFAAFATGQAILAGKDLETSLGDPGVIRSVIGAGLYLAVLGLLALGLGTLIRRTAGAIAALVGLVLILPVLAQGLPAPWQAHITRYLPSVAGQAIIGRTKFAPPGHPLPPGRASHCSAPTPPPPITLNRRDA
jgi:ABC-2 type transport system permease protein